MNRRGVIRLLCCASAGVMGGGGSVLSSAAPAVTSTEDNLKFDKSGMPVRFSGNTIICHIPLHNKLSLALIALRNQLIDAGFDKYYRFLPPSSYHMTVFDCINDASKKRNIWPKELAPEAKASDSLQFIKNKLSNFSLPIDMPLAMQPGKIDYGNTTLKLRLLPFNQVEADKLRLFRDALANTLGFKYPDHDTKIMHITLAYRFAQLGNQDTTYFNNAAHHAQLFFSNQINRLDFAYPEFCDFIDMFSYNTQMYLNGV